MEGELWKWTNYWNGWQSRWFILEDGILSYYKSYDEVSQGCKGSLNVSSCEIVVHTTDHNRFDVIISGGEQYMYLRASNEKERQQWLIALGTAKTNINNRPRRTRVSSVTSTHSGANDVSEDSKLLKTKKSELRLYCDLLMQQVHQIKDSVNSDGTVDNSTLDEGASLLPQTCDMFMKTLDDVMRLSDASFVYTVSSARVGDPAAESALHHAHGSSRKNSRSSISQDRSATPVSGAHYHERFSPSPSDETSHQKSHLKSLAEEKISDEPSRGFRSVFGSNHGTNNHPGVIDSSPEHREVKPPGKAEPVYDLTRQPSRVRQNQLLVLSPDFPKTNSKSHIDTQRFLSAAQGVLLVYDGDSQFFETTS